MEKVRTLKPKTFELPETPRLTPVQWLVLLLVTAASFACLLLLGRLSRIPAVLIFVFVPLITLAWMKRDIVKTFIRKPSGRDIGIGVGFGFISLGVSFVIARLITLFGQAVPANPIFGMFSEQPVQTVIATVIQLFGEELFTLIVFLFFVQVFESCLKNRKSSIIVAWILSSVVFGLVHLPAYHNLVHVLLTIGVSRIILTLAFLRTKNLTASYISHMVDDFASFAIAFALSALLSGLLPGV